MGDFWNEDGVKANREGIIQTNKEVGKLFARAYRYIKAAAAIYEDTSVINSWAIDRRGVNAEAKAIINNLFGNFEVANKEGKQRKLFASAITPDGYKNYLNSILTTKTIYSIMGEHGTGTEALLEKILRASVEAGYNTECYYCALFPEKLEHIVIPGLEVSFTTVNDYHAGAAKDSIEVNLNKYLDSNLINNYKETIEYNKSQFDDLMNKAIETIGRAKKLHDYMESFYIPNMDFEAVQRCLESTMARILEYE